jgi:AraC family transcriptional regulator of adaptative response/methylated-DNA-[protein]-cysteine methyltransferase
MFGSAAGRTEPITLLLKGTNFQIKVWRALLQIPPGTAATYGALAEAIDQPTAARAVANAVGKNPIAYLIPCHRVLRESGDFGGYRWGGARKQAIFGWEAARAAG